MRLSRLPLRTWRRPAAFSLIELLAVIVMVAILASLVMREVFGAKRTCNSVACLDNLKQLQLAASIYTGDHEDFLPPNGWASPEWLDGCPQGYSSAAGSWVMGNAPTEETEAGIRNGVLFPYVKSAACYHCPVDKSKVDKFPQLLRKRSYSASYYMNGSKATGYAQVKAKASQINDPSNKFVYLDEHENSIDDGVFFTHVPGDAGEQDESRDDPGNHYAGAHWMNMPSDRHNKGCNLSFADGSARPRKWLWPKKLLTDADRAPVNDLDFRDLRWLQAGIPDISLQWTVAAGADGPGHPGP